jgi:hypothetical protein
MITAVLVAKTGSRGQHTGKQRFSAKSLNNLRPAPRAAQSCRDRIDRRLPGVVISSGENDRLVRPPDVVSRRSVRAGIGRRQPEVAQRFDEPTMSIRAPWRFMVPDTVDGAVGAGVDSMRDDRVAIIDEHLDSDGRRLYLARAVPPVVSRLGEKSRCATKSRPTTEPRFHSSVAPIARLYHRRTDAFGTASMSEITGPSAPLVELRIGARSVWTLSIRPPPSASALAAKPA